VVQDRLLVLGPLAYSLPQPATPGIDLISGDDIAMIRTACCLLTCLAIASAEVPPPLDPFDPEEAAFLRRADFLTARTAATDLDTMRAWFDRVPYFQDGGGDPHKYALPGVIARLHLDPEDPAALRMARFLAGVNVAKGDRGLYHFAAYQRVRLFCALGPLLPEDLIAGTMHDVRHHYAVLRAGGTENHRFMHRCSGYLFAEKVPGPYAGKRDRDEHLEWQRKWLRGQVRRLYTIGMGEYDSSTYVGYTMASWANIHDYADDERMRILARAALDWYCVALGRKYFHGCQLGPESRGFAREPVGTRFGTSPRRPGMAHMDHAASGSGSDWACWLFWGDSDREVAFDEPSVATFTKPVNVLALTSYRPHPLIRKLGRKAVELPYESRGSKPAYSGDRGNKDHEYLFFDREYAMGTLYSPERGVRTRGTILPQTTMFKLLARGDGDVLAFGMGNGYHGHFPLEGRTPFDQYHQHGAAAVNVCFVDEGHEGLDGDRVHARSLFGFPAAAGDPVEDGGWYFWRVGDAFVAARPLGATAVERDDAAVMHGEPKRASGYRWLVADGKLGGWVVQAGQVDDATPDLAAFRTAVRERCALDLATFTPEERTVTFTSLAGHELRLRHTGGPGGRPEAWTDGETVAYEDRPVYDSPWVREDLGSGILRVTDGAGELVIDCSGEWPVYRE